jgi:hypothetical protein
LLFFNAVKRKSGSFHCAIDTRFPGEEASGVEINHTGL